MEFPRWNDEYWDYIELCEEQRMEPVSYDEWVEHYLRNLEK